jgi:hypothetical protein
VSAGCLATLATAEFRLKSCSDRRRRGAPSRRPAGPAGRKGTGLGADFACRRGTSNEERAVKWIKRIVVLLVVIFALFYLFTRPTDAADAVRSAFGAVGNGLDAIVTFFTSLTA